MVVVFVEISWLGVPNLPSPFMNLCRYTVYCAVFQDNIVAKGRGLRGRESRREACLYIISMRREPFRVN